MYDENDEIISGFPRLKTLAEITTKFVKGIFDIKAESYTEDGVPFVRISNLKNGIIEENGLAYIPSEYHDLEQKTALVKYDLILSKTAYPAASIVQLDECNTSQDTIAVKTNRSKSFNVYLAIFLNTRFGLLQMQRLFQGNIQSHLSLPEAKTIKIPIPDIDFQSEINELFDQSLEQRQRAKNLYAEAEGMLLEALGLDAVDLGAETTYEASFDDVMGAGRLDAEYFQPKYQRLIDRLQEISQKPNWRLENLGNLSAPLKYGTSNKLEYLDSGIPFLRIADVLRYRFPKDNIKYISPEEAAQEYNATVKQGDVLISRTGTLGLSVEISKELDGAIYGSYFIRTRPKTDVLVPTYLALYLNSIVGQFQVEQSNTGAIQTNLTIPTLSALRIVIPPQEMQIIFSNHVQKAFEAEDEAKQLLEEAKARVEALVLGGV